MAKIKSQRPNQPSEAPRRPIWHGSAFKTFKVCKNELSAKGKLLTKAVTLRLPTQASPALFIKKQISVPDLRPLEPEFLRRTYHDLH